MFYAKQEILFDTLIVLFSLQVRSRVWNNPTKTRTAEGIKVVVASPIKVIQVSNYNHAKLQNFSILLYTASWLYAAKHRHTNPTKY